MNNLFMNTALYNNNGLGINSFIDSLNNAAIMADISNIFDNNYINYPGFDLNMPMSFQYPNLFMNQVKPQSINNKMVENHFNTKTSLPGLKDVYNPAISSKLATVANSNASHTDTVGWCARSVTQSLKDAGFTNQRLRVGSAYNLANKLDEHSGFKEVSVQKNDLSKLPAGCVIVWNASPGHKNGHTCVTLGNGKEASDHVQNLIVRKDADYKVYAPISVA